MAKDRSTWSLPSLRTGTLLKLLEPSLRAYAGSEAEERTKTDIHVFLSFIGWSTGSRPSEGIERVLGLAPAQRLV